MKGEENARNGEVHECVRLVVESIIRYAARIPSGIHDQVESSFLIAQIACVVEIVYRNDHKRHSRSFQPTLY